MDSLICLLLGIKDEYSFNSSTEEQNENKRLNVLEEGGSGEQNETKHYWCAVEVFFPFCFVVILFVENLRFCPAHTGWAQSRRHKVPVLLTVLVN